MVEYKGGHFPPHHNLQISSFGKGVLVHLNRKEIETFVSCIDNVNIKNKKLYA